MENLRIVRQDFIPSDSSTPVSDANSTIHMCPFDTLPQLESHIHPKFVIVNAGAKLVKLATVDVLKLVEDFPRLSSIITLYNAWTRELAEKELKDPSFDPDFNVNDNDGDGDDSGGDWTLYQGSYYPKIRKTPASQTSPPKNRKASAIQTPSLSLSQTPSRRSYPKNRKAPASQTPPRRSRPKKRKAPASQTPSLSQSPSLSETPPPSRRTYPKNRKAPASQTPPRRSRPKKRKAPASQTPSLSLSLRGPI